ncbi:MAG: MarR family transcriptional regulator [Proteobacteria bacterium]|nr:MAG: MarR family transcriptional regulator [Pseudomonadota bacterium]
MIFLKTMRKLAEAFQSFEQLSSKHIRTLGLTPGQFDVIATLGNQPPMTCSELAEKTLMVKGNLTVILDGLVKKGLITRTTNPNDGRSLIISLTPAGDNVFKEVFPTHLKYLQPLIKQFDIQELGELDKRLTKFCQQIETFSKNLK